MNQTDTPKQEGKVSEHRRTSSHASWKWMSATGATLMASPSSANADLVEITLQGNQISATGGSSLFTDLTGDGVPDVSFSRVSNYASFTYFSAGARVFGVSANSAPGQRLMVANAFIESGTGGAVSRGGGTFRLLLGAYEFFNGGLPQTESRVVPFRFTDTHINLGVSTLAMLEVVASAVADPEASVILTRVIFDKDDPTGAALTGFGAGDPTSGVFAVVSGEAAAVPEPEAFGLGLLALGASGVLRRRRRLPATSAS